MHVSKGRGTGPVGTKGDRELHQLSRRFALVKEPFGKRAERGPLSLESKHCHSPLHWHAMRMPDLCVIPWRSGTPAAVRSRVVHPKLAKAILERRRSETCPQWCPLGCSQECRLTKRTVPIRRNWSYRCCPSWTQLSTLAVSASDELKYLHQSTRVARSAEQSSDKDRYIAISLWALSPSLCSSRMLRLG